MNSKFQHVPFLLCTCGISVLSLPGGAPLSRAVQPPQVSYTGLTAPASACDPTVSMTLLHTAARALLTGAWSRTRAHARTHGTECGLHTALLRASSLPTPRQCYGTAPPRVLSHASRSRQRPERVEIDV